MNRRQFIFALTGVTTLLGTVPALRAECGELGASEFVESFYGKQARLQVEMAPLGEDTFVALFSRDMRALMRAPRHYPKDVQLGPLLNAFFGWGVLPGTEVEVAKVDLVSGKEQGPATISVGLKYRGESRKVLVNVVREGNDWRIADISYDSGGSLADHYRAMTAR